MGSAPSAELGRAARRRPPLPVKIVIAGGFGVGKTTAVGSISEISPLTTEADMTAASLGIDDTTKVPGKRTTTVAMDFGCITIDESLKLYLFGTPGQDRFGFMWDDLAEGALGAVVLVDTRRIDDCFVAVDYFEARNISFVVGVNYFEGSELYDLDEIRDALGLEPDVPVMMCDARTKDSVKDVLLHLVRHLAAQARASQQG